MRLVSSSFGVALLFVACTDGRGENDRKMPPKKHQPAYAVTCRVVAEISAEDMKARNVQPLSFTVPRIVVSNGGTASICDKSERAFAFGDGLTVQGKRGAIERKATEGTTIEATVVAQDDEHVVLDVSVEFTSANSAEKQGSPVRVDFFKARWIERVELDKTVKFAARDGHLEVTVKAIDETVGDSARTTDRDAADLRPVGKATMRKSQPGQLAGLTDEVIVLPKRDRAAAKGPTAAATATRQSSGLVGITDEIISLPRKNRQRD